MLPQKGNNVTSCVSGFVFTLPETREMRVFDKIFSRSTTPAKPSMQEQIEQAISKEMGENLVADKQIAVTEELSLSLAAVWSCVRLISDSIAILPIHLYERTDRGRVKTYGSPVRNLLYKPNEYQNKSLLFSAALLSVLLWGNGYIRIFRDKMYRPVRLKFLQPTDVWPFEAANGERWYYLYKGETLGCDDLIHLRGLSTDGMRGKSPIAVHRENMQLSMAAQRYGKDFFTNGGNPSLIFKKDGILKDQKAYERLRNDLFSRVMGVENAHKPLLLEGGMNVEKLTIPPEDAQFITTRKFQSTEVARIFGVPPHMIADLERATNNNIEHQGIEFVTNCLQPYAVKFEEELDRKLLREDEFGRFYFKFSFNSLLRGDAKTRSEYYKNMNMVGAMNANEIRALEDMNKYDGGDSYFVQANMQTVENSTLPSQNNNQQLSKS